jgi:hypothetical protein
MAIQPVGDAAVLAQALTIWSRVHGLVSLEIIGQFPPFIVEPGEIFRCEIEAILKATLTL